MTQLRERERESWGTMNWVIYEGGFIQDKISTIETPNTPQTFILMGFDMQRMVMSFNVIRGCI